MGRQRLIEGRTQRPKLLASGNTCVEKLGRVEIEEGRLTGVAGEVEEVADQAAALGSSGRLEGLPGLGESLE